MTTAKTPAKKPAAKTAAKPAAKKAAPEAAATPAPAAAAADIFAMPKFDMKAFDMKAFEMPANPLPEMVREMAEKGVSSARDNYEKVRVAAEEQNAAVEKSFDTARESSMELNRKALDNAQSNMEAGFNFVRDILSVKSVGDAIEVQTSFARAQFDAMSAQAKDFQEAVNQSVTDTTAPVQEIMNKTIKAA